MCNIAAIYLLRCRYYNGVIWDYGVDCTFYVHANEWMERCLEMEKKTFVIWLFFIDTFMPFNFLWKEHNFALYIYNVPTKQRIPVSLNEVVIQRKHYGF